MQSRAARTGKNSPSAGRCRNNNDVTWSLILLALFSPCDGRRAAIGNRFLRRFEQAEPSGDPTAIDCL